MPSKSSGQSVDTSDLKPISFGKVTEAAPPIHVPIDEKNPFLRSPMPRIDAAPDSLRQFYSGGIPQFRVMPPPVAAVSGIKGEKGDTGPQGSPGTPAKSTGGGAKRVTIPLTTASIANNASATGTVPLGRSFIIIEVKASAACRIRLYSTAAARTADASRPSLTSPILYTEHGVIIDLVLDSSLAPFPVTWICSPEAPGSDAEDSPVGDISYSVTNLSGSTQSFTITFTVLVEDR